MTTLMEELAKHIEGLTLRIETLETEMLAWQSAFDNALFRFACQTGDLYRLIQDRLPER